MVRIYLLPALVKWVSMAKYRSTQIQDVSHTNSGRESNKYSGREPHKFGT